MSHKLKHNRLTKPGNACHVTSVTLPNYTRVGMPHATVTLNVTVSPDNNLLVSLTILNERGQRVNRLNTSGLVFKPDQLIANAEGRIK